MADSSFGVKKFNLVGSGTPKIESPNNINLNAINVAISTNATVGGTLDVGGNITATGSVIGSSDLVLNAAADSNKIKIQKNLEINTLGYGSHNLTNEQIIIKSTYNNSIPACNVTFYKQSANPADGHYISELIFKGRNDNNEDVEYANIYSQMVDISDGDEGGEIKISTMKNGTSTATAVFAEGTNTFFGGINASGTSASTFGGTVTATGGFIGDGSNLTGISVVNASKVNIQESNSSSTQQVVFSAQNGTGNQDLYIDTNDSHLSYSPNLGRLYTPNYTGGSGGTSGSGLHHLSSTTISRDGMTVGADQSADAPAYLSSNCIRLDAQTGNLKSTGICTASYFYGDGSNLTGISGGGGSSDKISEGNTEVETIDTGSDGHVKITTEGTERVRITHQGRVGIGSDDPTQQLDVAGVLKVYGSDGPGKETVINPNSSGGTGETIIGKANADLRIQAGSGAYQSVRANVLLKNSGANVIINGQSDNAGKVGIGNLSPTEKLDVTGNIKASGTCTASHFYGDGSNLTSITASSVSGVSDDANFNTNGGDNTGLSASSTLIFGTSIGQKFGFTRWGSNQFVYLRTSNSSSYNYGTLKIRSDRGQTSSAQPIYATDSGASIIMAQYDGDVMLCSQTGNSNIGEVTGGYTNAGWHFDVTGMAKCCVDSGSSNPNCKMYRKVTGDAIQFIDRAGSSDDEIGSITMNLSSNSTAYNTTSDYRIKENVVNITGALAKINQLRPVNFNFIGKSVKLDGFLAHEVQAIVPYAVTGDKDAVKTVKDGDLSNDGSESDYVRIAALPTKEVPSLQQMDNSKLIGLLTAAVQELSAKNDALEARIAALES